MFGIIFQLATCLISSWSVPSRRSPSSIPISSILDVKQFDYIYIASKTKIQKTFFVDLSLRLHFRILSKLQIEPNWRDHLDLWISSNIKVHQRLMMTNPWSSYKRLQSECLWSKKFFARTQFFATILQNSARRVWTCFVRRWFTARICIGRVLRWQIAVCFHSRSRRWRTELNGNRFINIFIAKW